MSVPLPSVPKGPRVSVPVSAAQTKGPHAPVPSVPKGTGSAAHCRLTALPYDSLYLRFRPSPPRDRQASSLYGWVSFVGSSTNLTGTVQGLPVSNCQESPHSEGVRVRSSPNPSDCQRVVANGDRKGWDSPSLQGQQTSVKRLDLDLHSTSTNRLAGSKECACEGTGKAEPLFSDPSSGAPLLFQHRLHQLANLQADTVKEEKGRRGRKKPFPATNGSS
ncbi:hypothetical protein ACOMHN_022942 [Nucella lapillus]